MLIVWVCLDFEEKGGTTQNGQSAKFCEARPVEHGGGVELRVDTLKQPSRSRLDSNGGVGKPEVPSLHLRGHSVIPPSSHFLSFCNKPKVCLAYLMHHVKLPRARIQGTLKANRGMASKK